MADCAIFILWDELRGMALMEDRPDLNPETKAGLENYWVYPGGKVEEGETAEQAMLRECGEEAGILPLEYQLLSDGENLRSYPRPGTRQFAKSHEGWRAIPFVITKWSGDVPLATLDENKANLVWINPLYVAKEPTNEYTCNVQIARLLMEGKWHDSYQRQ